MPPRETTPLPSWCLVSLLCFHGPLPRGLFRVGEVLGIRGRAAVWTHHQGWRRPRAPQTNTFLSQPWLLRPEVKRIIQRGGGISIHGFLTTPCGPWLCLLTPTTSGCLSPAAFPPVIALRQLVPHPEAHSPSASFEPGTLPSGHFVSFRPSRTLGGGPGTLTLPASWAWKLRLAQVTQP